MLYFDFLTAPIFDWKTPFDLLNFERSLSASLEYYLPFPVSLRSNPLESMVFALQ